MLEDPVFHKFGNVAMSPSLKINKGYGRLEHVERPEDLLGPNYWRADSKLLWDLPDEIQEKVGRVAESGNTVLSESQAPISTDDTR